MLENPIPQQSFFVTPTEFKALEEFAKGCQNPGEAMQMLCYTLNFCHHLVEVAKKED